MAKQPLHKLLILSVLACAVIYFPAPSEAFRFVVTGDTRGSDNGVNAIILAEMIQATIDEAADFIVVTGDLVNGSSDPLIFASQLNTWRKIVQPLYDSSIGVYPCRGNHDTGSKEVWDAVFSGSYVLPGNGPVDEENVTYSFVHENSLFISLDQYGSHVNRVNQTWLDIELDSNLLPHVFIFGHVPAFSVYHLDCLDDYPDERDRFWQSIADGCGRTYFTGHDHFYNHARIDDGDGNTEDDLHQIITGAGGAPMYDWNGIYGGNNGSWIPQLVFHEKQYSYVLADVDGLTVTLTMKHRTAPGIYEEGGDTLSFIYADADDDGKGDSCDNCPITPNPDQLDSYPPQGNSCGNACDCEGNFDIDDNVDGSDASSFKRSYGRNDGNRPCTNDDPCKGDFLCDGDVDGTDASKFKSDFGRSSTNNPCPSCHTEPWCQY